MRRMKSLGRAVAVLGVGVGFQLAQAPVSHASGFEKAILWGAKHAGAGGTGVSGVGGSDSLYFNPASLGSVAQGEASINFSPTFVNLKGPVLKDEILNESATKFLPVVGTTVAYRVTPEFVIGAGAYVAGGARSYFESLDFTSTKVSQPLPTGNNNLRPDVIADLTVIEYSLGASYEVLPRFKIGAAWRIMQVNARIDTAALLDSNSDTSPDHFVNVSIQDLSATEYTGFRFGASYDGDGWGLGATLRTSVKFTANGTTTGRAVLLTGPNTPIINQTAAAPTTATNTFPLQVALGGYYDVTPDFRLLGEWAFHQYNVNDILRFSGTMPITTQIGTNPLDVSRANIVQNWQNFHAFRLGGVYRLMPSFVVRGGYAFSQSATPKANARPTFSPPGSGHSLTLGAGTSVMEDRLDIDLALEYAFASATVGAAERTASTASTAASAFTGEYSGRAMAAHIGATLRF